jgi:hypothetical protein
MPPVSTRPEYYGLTAQGLFDRGVARARLFCWANDVELPPITVVPAEDWHVNACAYYRPTEGVRICLKHCARAAAQAQVRTWSWPGSVTDREPYGVVCHEIGHHCDFHESPPASRGWYFGAYGIGVRVDSGESPITSYCPNDAEWFAEMFRLFITNPALLRLIRPRTYRVLVRKWVPIGSDDWEKELGPNVPPRILANLHRQVREGK